MVGGRTFLHEVFKFSPSDSWIYCFTKARKGKGRSRRKWFPAESTDDLWSYASQVSLGSIWDPEETWLEVTEDGRDVYFGHGVQTGEGHYRPVTRHQAHQIAGFGAICVDIDLPAAHRMRDDLPPNVEVARSALDESGLAPSAIVHTGHGLHVWWFLTEWLVLESDNDRAWAQRFSDRAHRALLGPLRSRGYHVDNTSGIERIHRIPGTMNMAGSTSEPVRILELHPERRYEVTDFEDLERPSDDFVVATTGAGSGAVGSTSEFSSATGHATNAQRPPAKLDPVLGGCPFLRHVRDDAGTLPEPDWFMGHALLAQIEGGLEVDHEWGSAYPGYTVAETNASFQRARRLNPPGCQTVEDWIGDKYCTNCARRGQPSPPTVLGLPRTQSGQQSHRQITLDAETFDTIVAWCRAARSLSYHGKDGSTDLCLIDFIYRTCLLNRSTVLDLAASYVAIALTVTPVTASSSLSRLVKRRLLNQVLTGPWESNRYALNYQRDSMKDNDSHVPCAVPDHSRTTGPDGFEQVVIHGAVRGRLAGQPEGLILAVLRSCDQPVTKGEIARRTGKSVKATTEPLEALVEVGAVEAVARRYEAVPDVPDAVLADLLGIEHERAAQKSRAEQERVVIERKPSGGLIIQMRPPRGRRPPTSRRVRRGLAER